MPTEYGTFIDPRDGRTYKIVKIGKQIWMAENLNYDAGEGCWIYGNKPSKAAKYGRLYDWETARGIAPPGWHLPSFDEWWDLEFDLDYRGSQDFSGTKLKSTTRDWKKYGHIKAHSTNESGFTGLPGGGRTHNGRFEFMGQIAYFWSSTEDKINTNRAWCFLLTSDKSVGELHESDKSRGLSVRCINDTE